LLRPGVAGLHFRSDQVQLANMAQRLLYVRLRPSLKSYELSFAANESIEGPHVPLGLDYFAPDIVSGYALDQGPCDDDPGGHAGTRA
jgi:hypothetical protein